MTLDRLSSQVTPLKPCCKLFSRYFAELKNPEHFLYVGILVPTIGSPATQDQFIVLTLDRRSNLRPPSTCHRSDRIRLPREATIRLKSDRRLTSTATALDESPSDGGVQWLHWKPCSPPTNDGRCSGEERTVPSEKSHLLMQCFAAPSQNIASEMQDKSSV